MGCSTRVVKGDCSWLLSDRTKQTIPEEKDWICVKISPKAKALASIIDNMLMLKHQLLSLKKIKLH